jgi:hypothetical protein
LFLWHVDRALSIGLGIFAGLVACILLLIFGFVAIEAQPVLADGGWQTFLGTQGWFPVEGKFSDGACEPACEPWGGAHRCSFGAWLSHLHAVCVSRYSYNALSSSHSRLDGRYTIGDLWALGLNHHCSNSSDVATAGCECIFSHTHLGVDGATDYCIDE